LELWDKHKSFIWRVLEEYPATYIPSLILVNK
jgi:hypothetical protein